MASEVGLRILSVNVGKVQLRQIAGRRVMTAYAKQPVQGPVPVAPLGLQGDEQADPGVHGGLAKAVYAYSTAHYPFWRTVRAQARVSGWDDALPFGALGENLSVEGLDERELWIGDRLVLPGCTLAVTEPRRPCFKFDAAMGFAQASRLMRESGFCGAYLGVLEPGTLAAGDPIDLQPGPRQVNLRELFRARAR